MSSNCPPKVAAHARGRSAWLTWLTVTAVIFGFVSIGVMQRFSSTAPSERSWTEIESKLNGLPMQIAGWKATPTTIDAKQLRVTEAVGSLSRIYRYQGQAVAVLLLYGPPGPLGAHTPDVCYAGNGHRPLGSPYRIGGDQLGGELWASQFEAPGTPPDRVEVLWAWGTNGHWLASSNPRVEFAGHTGIFKLYVSRKIAAGAEDPGPPLPFLHALFHECQVALAN